MAIVNNMLMDKSLHYNFHVVGSEEDLDGLLAVGQQHREGVLPPHHGAQGPRRRLSRRLAVGKDEHPRMGYGRALPAQPKSTLFDWAQANFMSKIYTSGYFNPCLQADADTPGLDVGIEQ